MNVDAMLAEITSAQFAEWLAFYELEPFGPAREEHRAGVLAATVANSTPFRRKGAKVLGPGDFFRTLASPEQTPRQMLAVARTIAAAKKGPVLGVGEFNRRFAAPRG